MAVKKNALQQGSAAKPPKLASREKTTKNSSSKTENSSLTSEERLNAINEKIRATYEFCKSSGMTEMEIEKSAQPLFKLVSGARKKQYTRKLLKIIIVASVISFLFYYDPTYRQLCIVWKLATVKLLPYWDWTAIYYSDCLIDNPHFEGPFQKSAMTDENCKVCQQLSAIESARGVSVEDAAHLLTDHVPLVVTDAMIDWWAVTKNIDTSKIKQLYRNNGLTSGSDVCAFIGDHPGETTWETFLNSTRSGRWNVRWMNCAKKSVRLVRNMYKRPYFVPYMVEMEKQNWVVSNHQDSSDYQRFELYSPMNLFSQVKGQYSVRLTPTGSCQDVCSPLSHTLTPGEILMFTNLWNLEYKPVIETENLAFVTGGFWGPTN